MITQCSDEFLTRIADILGSGSAATRAIAERDRRRGAGEDAKIFWDRDRGVLYVGPSPSTDRGERDDG